MTRILTRLLIAGVFSLTGVAHGQSAPRVLVLALDGVPFSSFQELQKDGQFTQFRPAAKMISTFPATSNYAWSVMFGTEPINSYQAKHYNLKTNGIEGKVIAEATQPTFANEYDFISHKVILKIKGYITGNASINYDLKSIKKAILASPNPQLFYAYSASTDVITHMKGEQGLKELLSKVDTMISQLRAEHLKKFNQALEVIIVSDHGNNLEAGEIVNMKKVFKSAGYKLTGKLNGLKDVVQYNSGILSVTSFWTRPEEKANVAQLLASQPFTGMVVYECGPTVVCAANPVGKLSFEYDENNRYRIVQIKGGDPLGLTPALKLNTWYSADDVLRASAHGEHPNSLPRMVRGLKDGVLNPGHINFSYKQGFESGSLLMKKIGKVLKGRSGTHGSLHAKDTLGVMASTFQDLPQYIPADQVAQFIPNHDFDKKFVDVTYLGDGQGQITVRLGQHLLDLPTLSKVKVEIKKLNIKTRKYDINLPTTVATLNSGLLEQQRGQARFADIKPAKALSPSTHYQVQLKALDGQGKTLAVAKPVFITPEPYKHYKKTRLRLTKRAKKLLSAPESEQYAQRYTKEVERQQAVEQLQKQKKSTSSHNH